MCAARRVKRSLTLLRSDRGRDSAGGMKSEDYKDIKYEGELTEQSIPDEVLTEFS